MVGMFDYMELVDDSLTVLEGFLNPLAETERHVAGDETDSFRIASAGFKVDSEPLDYCLGGLQSRQRTSGQL